MAAGAEFARSYCPNRERIADSRDGANIISYNRREVLVEKNVHPGPSRSNIHLSTSSTPSFPDSIAWVRLSSKSSLLVPMRMSFSRRSSLMNRFP